MYGSPEVTDRPMPLTLSGSGRNVFASSLLQTIAAAAPSVVGQQSSNPNGLQIIGAFTT